MLEKLRTLIIREAGSSRAPAVLFAVAFVESSFFPIPPDALLAPMVLRRPDKWLHYILICMIGSVLGGLLGYAIGYYFMDTVGEWLARIYHLEDGMQKFQAMFAQYGAMIILIKGLTPIPYKLVTIASGIAHYPLLPFVVLSCITRGGRFAIVAGILRFCSPVTRAYIEKNLVWFMLGMLVVALAGTTLALKMM